MEEMVTAQEPDCPFEFNFDPDTFKPGDLVSYRVPERFADMPFVGVIIAVEDDHILLAHNDGSANPEPVMRGTRTSRPEVSAKDALGE